MLTRYVAHEPAFTFVDAKLLLSIGFAQAAIVLGDDLLVGIGNFACLRSADIVGALPGGSGERELQLLDQR